MPVQQQPAANIDENLSGIGMVVKSVNTLTEAGFGQDQSLALAQAISGIISTEISACLKPFMQETNRCFQAIDDRLGAMAETNKARFQAIDDRLEAMAEVNRVRHESSDGRLKSVENKVDWLQKTMVVFAVAMGGSIVALTTLFFGAVLMMLGK